MSTDITEDIDFQALFSSDLTDNGTSTRKYSKDDHVIIDAYKDRYMAAKTAYERTKLAQLDMFPALFNHWKENGIIYDKRDLLIKGNVCSS
jgi:hypothetical protein